MDKPRKIAVQALQKCENDGYSNLVLNHMLERSTLSPRDKGFVSIIVYGTIERKMLIDFILQKFIAKPLKKLDAPVRAILRSGLYQCLFLTSVPNSASINEAVELTKSFGKTSAGGMVNAVLRKASQVDVKTLKFDTQVQRTSVLYNLSEPVAVLIMKYYPDTYQDILEASFQKPALAIRVNTLKISQEALLARFAEKNIQVDKTDIENCLHLHFKGDCTKIKEFREGMFYIQGMPSQITALAVNAKKGEKIVDLCSAPGGKGATIVQQMQNEGVLYAADIQKNRLSLIDELFTRTGVNIGEIIHCDASVYNETFENADAVLCDVPCTGLGILAKKPDIRYKDLVGLDGLVKLQKQILKTASMYVKIGGRLIYSTCTINPEENQQVVKDFLANNPSFKLTQLDITGVEQGSELVFLPKEGQSDGFYIANLERMC